MLCFSIRRVPGWSERGYSVAVVNTAFMSLSIHCDTEASSWELYEFQKQMCTSSCPSTVLPSQMHTFTSFPRTVCASASGISTRSYRESLASNSRHVMYVYHSKFSLTNTLYHPHQTTTKINYTIPEILFLEPNPATWPRQSRT